MLSFKRKGIKIVQLTTTQARKMGYTTEPVFDKDKRILRIEPLVIKLGGLLEKESELNLLQIETGIRSAVNAAVKRVGVPLNEKYDRLSAEHKKRLQEHLGRLKVRPGLAGALESVGRIERHYKIEGWESTLKRASEQYLMTHNSTPPSPGHKIAAAHCYGLIGQKLEKARIIDEVIQDINTNDIVNRFDVLLLKEDLEELVGLLKHKRNKLYAFRWHICKVSEGLLRYNKDQQEAHLSEALKMIPREVRDAVDLPGFNYWDQYSIAAAWTDMPC